MSPKAGFILPLALALGGWCCTAPQPAPNIADPEAAVKIAGIKQAAANKDRSALPALIAQLDSDDPAVRFFAIQALETFAQSRLGYEYYFDEEQRKPALERWRQWLNEQKDVPAAPDKQ